MQFNEVPFSSSQSFPLAQSVPSGLGPRTYNIHLWTCKVSLAGPVPELWLSHRASFVRGLLDYLEKPARSMTFFHQLLGALTNVLNILIRYSDFPKVFMAPRVTYSNADFGA